MEAKSSDDTKQEETYWRSQMVPCNCIRDQSPLSGPRTGILNIKQSPPVGQNSGTIALRFHFHVVHERILGSAAAQHEVLRLICLCRAVGQRTIL